MKDRTRYEALVRRLEDFARRHPAAYRRRVGILAAAGYGYVLFVLTVTLALLIAIAWAAAADKSLNSGLIRIILFLGILVYLIVRSLWVRFPPPEGIELHREQAPALFEMAYETAGALEAPRPDRVLVTDDLNAAAMQRPRLGILGWHENLLLLGLPLMEALSPDEFRSVVAHELGHLSGRHGRFTAWIYRIDRTWKQVLEETRKHRGGWLFRVFFQWYYPRFNAYSFALRRAQEYEADAAAVRMAGAGAAASALMRLEVTGPFVGDSFWKPMSRRAMTEPEPPRVQTLLASALRCPPAAEDARRWLSAAFHEQTDYSDSHPALTDRLAAMGAIRLAAPPVCADVRFPLPDGVALPDPVQESAAERYLPEAREALAAQLDARWQASRREEWRKRHEQARKELTRLAELDQKAATGSPTGAEIIERALLTSRLRTEAESIPLLRAASVANPARVDLRYALAQDLLLAGDPSGVGVMEEAMRLESRAVIGGCKLIYGFLQREGRFAEADKYRERAGEHYGKEVTAHIERSTVQAKDRLVPHDVSAEDLERLVRYLAGIDRIKAAWLARKQVQEFQDRPLFVLAVQATGQPRNTAFESHQQLAQRILNGLALPGQSYVVVFASPRTDFARRVRKVPGSAVFSRRARRRGPDGGCLLGPIAPATYVARRILCLRGFGARCSAGSSTTRGSTSASLPVGPALRSRVSASGAAEGRRRRSAALRSKSRSGMPRSRQATILSRGM